jgi:hypothetical protein
MDEGLREHFRHIAAHYSTASLRMMLAEAVKAIEKVGTHKIQRDFAPWIETLRAELASRNDPSPVSPA